VISRQGAVFTLGAALILANVLWFAHGGFAAYFSPDDMSNAYGYFITSTWKLAGALVVFFSSYYRPMGALFYLPLFRFFGLNPLPYHIAEFAIMLANTYLVYRVARRVSGSRLAAGLAAFVLSFHRGMAEVYYSPAVMYDVLCFFFYFLALTLYLETRARGEIPRGRRAFGIVLAYVCALNSKEMAVTLPVVLLAYEAVHYGERCAGRLRMVIVTGALTAVYVAGKMLGPDPLARMPGYIPVLTWAQFVKASVHHLDSLTLQFEAFSLGTVLALWAVALGVALVRGRPDLRFCWLWIMAAPLPVVFLNRSHAALYIPLAAWAIYLATAITVASRWLGAAAARWCQYPPYAVLVPLLAAGVAAGSVFHANTEFRDIYERDMEDQGQAAKAVVNQLRDLDLRVKPHSTVMFLDDPFVDWDLVFIAGLWFRDPTVTIWLQNKHHLRAEEADKMDYVFRFEQGNLVRVKP
jgi:hypothetical protein